MGPEEKRDGDGRAVARPDVSILLPFHGTTAEADAAVEALLAVDMRPGDEVVVADNSPVPAVHERAGIVVVRADREQSSYYARNTGAEVTRNEWLLLVDADCRPAHDIVDRYFDEVPTEDIGAVVGEVVGAPGQEALVSRYARSRGHLGQLAHWTSPFRPWGITANLLVRRAAWESVGGFQEGIRSTGDAEFSWRLQDAGWRLDYRPDAVVYHRHRESVRKLARQAARYGAGQAWVRRRYPESGRRPRLARELARCAAGVLAWTATGRFERAAFKALDAVYVSSEWAASRLSNVPPVRRTPAEGSRVAVAGIFPALDDATGVARVRASGAVAVEAASRPVRVDRAAARSLNVAWADDDGTLRRLSAMLWLAGRRPIRLLRYILGGRARPRVRDLATRARRLALVHPAELYPASRAAAREAQALGALLGIHVPAAGFEPTAGEGPGGESQSTSVR